MHENDNLLVLPRVFKQHLKLEDGECAHDWESFKEDELDGYQRCEKCGAWGAYAVLPPMAIYHDREISSEIYRRACVQAEIYNMAIEYLCARWGKAYQAAVKDSEKKGYKVPLLSGVKKHLPSKFDLFKQTTVWRKQNPHLNKGLLDTCRAGTDAAFRAFLLRADKYLEGERNIQKVRDTNAKRREKNKTLKDGNKESMRHPSKQDQKWASIQMSNPERLLKDLENTSKKTTLLSLNRADVLDGQTFKIPSLGKRNHPVETKKRLPEGLDVRSVTITETPASVRNRHRTAAPEHRKYFLRPACLVRIPPPPALEEAENASAGYDVGGHRPCVASSGETFRQPDTTESCRRSGNYQRESSRNTKNGSRKQKKYARKAEQETARRSRRKVASEQRYASDELKKNRLVAFEDIPHKNLRRNTHGTRRTPGSNVAAKTKANRTMDIAAPGRIRATFSGSAKFYGSYFTEVSARNTSQTCSACHKRLWRRLKPWEPYFVCGSFDCRNQMQRDHNAGRNVDRKGRDRMTELAEIYPDIFGAAAREQAERRVAVRGEGLEAGQGLRSAALVADVRPDPRQLHPHTRDIKACGSPRDTQAAA